ncbi:hypothetical protein HDU79_007475 [Rhizoclosmatium sp. JEL0117]|nr:hypothetical protein HDU79_007475 [Rhizoclosmatium sp. JEL0117]
MGYSVHHQQQQQNAFGGQQGMMHMGGAGDMMGFHGGFQGHQGFPDQSPQQQFMFAGNGGGMMGGNNGVGFPVMNQFSMMGNGNHQMNHPGMQSPMFGGSVMSMSSNTSSAVNMPTRTVYLGNIPAGTTYEDILNMVKFGPLESIKMIEEKSCCFLTFIEASSAMQFFNEYQGKRVLIGDQEIKFGWGKASICPQFTNIPTPPDVLNGSCRNVYIGQCDETVTEESLRTEFEPFGPIDQIRVIPDKHIAFVHLCSVAQAMKAVATLPNRPFFAGKKVNYGKDRCGNMLIGNSAPGNNPGHGNNMGGNGAMHLGGNNMGGAMGMGMGMNGMGGMNPVAAAMGMMNNGMGMGLGMLGAGNVGGMGVGNSLGGGFDPAAFAMMGNGGIPMNPQRTLYLGGLHPDATPKDICDVLRGGLVQKVNFLPEKNTAFVTFIDPMAAHALFVRGNNEGVVIKGKRVKIGWGKPAPVIPSTIFQALQQGATRNVYVGPLDASMDEDRLRTDFSEFGEIELINMVKDKNIGFVSFTDIASAIKVVENLQSSNPQYSSLRVAYGKDRCNNPLRPPRSQYLHHSQAGSEGGDSGFY